MNQETERERLLRSQLERAQRRDPALWLLIVASSVTLGLLALSAWAALFNAGNCGPPPGHIVLVGIFALLLALIALAIIRARQPH